METLLIKYNARVMQIRVCCRKDKTTDDNGKRQTLSSLY